MVTVFDATFNNISATMYIVAVSFIGRGTLQHMKTIFYFIPKIYSKLFVSEIVTLEPKK
jgi:hypothetical protein